MNWKNVRKETVTLFRHLLEREEENHEIPPEFPV
jgi:hypothetical protein